MPTKDYYVVLGVTRTETTAGIRSAYRALARRPHPDPFGEEATPTLEEINEAYEVLCDPGQRRSHNRNLRTVEEGPTQAWDWPAPAEPLVPDEDEAPSFSLLSDPSSVRPSGEALQERFSRNFTGVAVPKGERIEGLNMDLILTEDEAARGLGIQVRVPAPRPCGACGGTGHELAFTCLSCDGQGVIEGEVVVPVEIPPHVRTGSVVELPLAHLGIRNLVLRFHISVTGARDPLPLA